MHHRQQITKLIFTKHRNSKISMDIYNEMNKENKVRQTEDIDFFFFIIYVIITFNNDSLNGNINKKDVIHDNK